MDRTTTLIVGASVAGIRAATTLRSLDPDHRIILIDGEDEEPYDKPPLSKSALTQAEDISFTFSDHHGAGIDYRRATHAVSAAVGESTVNSSDGSLIHYDSAILATGSAPRRLRLFDHMPRVHYLRTLADARALRAALVPGRHVVVIGGGFIGCEVASSARERALEVTIIEAGPRLAARVLPEPVSRVLTAIHQQHGVAIRCDITVREAVYDPPRDNIRLTLDDGSVLVADVVVVGIGTEPATGWAAGSALPIDDGFVCGPDLRVSGTSNVYAIGDVARWHNPRYDRTVRVEHWTNAREHAAIAAHNIVHPDTPRHAMAVPFVWSDQHSVHIQHVGDPNLADVDIQTAQLSESGRLFTYFRDGALIGATAFDSQASLAKIRRRLIGPAGSTAAATIQPTDERGRA
ncbi:NAD(P)/FAD-dependent oxidoreductase [Nocardia fusca]|uniref:NAD(P)/FAD-dependent oxidoreductase n=1 Tax=Nocardia fusca TaxID=941183 RepID=UPI0037CC1C24